MYTIEKLIEMGWISHQEPMKDVELQESCKHVKISHYEGGITDDVECKQALNEIYNIFPECLPFVKYIHNHKGTILIFWDENEMRKLISDLNLSEKINLIESRTNIIEWVNYKTPSYLTEWVENTVRCIRNECEWISEYENEKVLMDSYQKAIKASPKTV